ncbi:hypothetical protein RUM44_007894 [Polyplax serrata]|uniref:Uncharacterized protein n=1 Tax=Polyplax serrata TaxID=468196 RepID=A0ABR1BAR8_POLSC
MSLGMSFTSRADMPDHFEFKETTYGVPNPIDAGWNSARVQLRSNHPLESSIKNFRNNQIKLNNSVMLHAQGPAGPLIQAMELRAVKQIGRHPFLPSSNFQLDVLTGKDMEMDFDDFLNTVDFKETQAQPHMEVIALTENNLEKYSNVRNLLGKLGYTYQLSPGNLPLLEELLKDLMSSKEEVEQYKQMVKKVDKEKLNLQNIVQPYKQDNGRLALENIDLHTQLFKLKQEYEKEQKEFQKYKRENKLYVEDLEFLYRTAEERVKKLEVCNRTISGADNKKKDKKRVKSSFPTYDLENFLNKNERSIQKTCDTVQTVNNGSIKLNKCEKMDRQASELFEEINELKLDNQHQADIIAALKCQITQKDREICRMRHALEGGRPHSAVSRDYCHPCKQKESKITSLEGELEETLKKQHEAMSRALHLAEKNQQLERELKDIDNMALAVEAECKSRVKNNLRNMDIVEEKLRQKGEEVRRLEETIMNLKNKIEHDEMELENLKRDKQMLERSLHTAAGEKKNLNDKINYFLLIEKNLNSEIARLQEINKSLQRQMCDMEERVVDILGTSCKGHIKTKPLKKQNVTSSLPASKVQTSANTVISSKLGKGCQKYNNSEEHSECFHKNSCMALLEKIQQERDFYHNECHRLKDQLGSMPYRKDNSTELIVQISDLEKEVIDLKRENCSLRHENSVNLKRLECSEHLSCSSGDSLKIIMDRLEKERDMALSDISRLQGERDALKEKMKLANESHIGEQARFEKITREYEERIRRLESERHELISSQSCQRIALANMEEKCDEYKENIRKVQSDYAQMKANYGQLKSLQEQTDRSLSDIQSRHGQIEMELRLATTKIHDKERIIGNLEDEILSLRKEKTNLMASVTFIEKEKDGLLVTLDNKTEKVAKLEAHIKQQEERARDLNEKVSHLEKKIE